MPEPRDSNLTHLELEAAIAQLQSVYWARVDDVDPLPPEELFTDDSVFELGSLILTGRAALAAFFDQRRQDNAAQGRTTRHLSANLRIRPIDAERVEVFSTVLMLSGNGEWPIPSVLPSIGDFSDVCVRGTDGSWRFERRKASSVFAAPNAASFAKSASGE
ncbi:MAG TPA: nuclear transport factor 2 family protein [Rhizomicrobium sp.]